MFKLVAIIALSAVALVAQGPKYGLGRPATAADEAAAGYAVPPSGEGLPQGAGTAAEGKRVYEAKCRECHGVEGRGDEQAALVGTHADLNANPPKKSVGSYWPYATTLWDYINRAMPFKQPGSLSTDEVYAVSAYILHLNGLMGEKEPLNEKTLPAVKMPNREGFVLDDRPASRP